MGQVGSIYLNFGLWAIALIPAWQVVREIGVSLGDRKALREGHNDIKSPGSDSADEDGKVAE